MSDTQAQSPSMPWLSAWPRGLPHNIHIPQTPIDHYLSVAAERYPTKAALVFMDRVWTYAELQAQVNAVAGHLQQVAQVQPGDRVTPGMTIAVLDDADQQLALSQAQARLVAALQPLLHKGLCQSPVRPGPDLQTLPTDLGRSAPARQPVQGRVGAGFHEAAMRADLEAPYRFLVTAPGAVTTATR